MTDIAPLLQAATNAAQRGQWSEAERLWRRVIEIAPEHPSARQGLGAQAFRRGELDAARVHLEAARRGAPRDPTLAMSLAVVRRQLGDAEGELKAIEDALAGEPYFLPALLARGDCLERHGRLRAAAAAYSNALKAAPPEPAWPQPLRPQLAHAREVATQHGRALSAFLAERMGVRLAGLGAFEAERWREAASILSGQSRPYHAECVRLHVPRLPAIPFFDRRDFPWVDALEAQTAAIRAELEGVLARQAEQFQPYVAYPAGAPVNQWTELNHSRRWSSYFLWRDGAPIAGAQAECPVTTAALQAVGMADIGGLCPNAMFSALAPKTHIPPHHGETNARLVVHLPLVVPARCSYRVGFERREWKVGEVLIFDDSIEHEARNDSDELRVVLIFDIWNPLLSADEREMMKTVSAAAREFHADA